MRTSRFTYLPIVYYGTHEGIKELQDNPFKLILGRTLQQTKEQLEAWFANITYKIIMIIRVMLMVLIMRLIMMIIMIMMMVIMMIMIAAGRRSTVWRWTGATSTQLSTLASGFSYVWMYSAPRIQLFKDIHHASCIQYMKIHSRFKKCQSEEHSGKYSGLKSNQEYDIAINCQKWRFAVIIFICVLITIMIVIVMMMMMNRYRHHRQ